jgi:flagellar export protein FliJ
MAKKFRFKLEAVHKLRERERDAQRRRVADAVRAVTDAEQRLASRNDSLRGTFAAGRDVQSSPRLDVGLIRSHRFYQSWLHGSILESSAEVGKRRRELAVERESLGRSNARFKSLEKLKERKWRRHLEDVKREELATFDEIGMQRFQNARIAQDAVVGAEVLIA